MNKKEWEEAWTLQKVRTNAEQWKLSGDAGLLMYLEECSTKMFDKFQNTETLLRTLNRDLQLTGVRLERTVNDFSMLSNKQFIENRVYDEDVASLKPTPRQNVENVKSKDQREQEMSDAIKFCLRQGCSMIDNSFQKINVLPEDFDESDDPTFKPDPIYEPKDPFANRLLPYVIGTSQFEKSRFVGLKDEMSQAEIHHDLSDEEVIEEIIPKVSSKSPFSPPQQTAPPPTPPPAPPLTVSVPQTIVKQTKTDNGPGSDNSGLFCGSAESVNDSLFLTPEKEKTQAVDFKAELNAKLERSDEEKILKSDTIVNKPATAPRKASQTKPTPVVADDNLFGPPPLPSEKVDSDDDKSLFGVRNDVFAASRTKGLFDDDDEQDSLFAPQPTIRSVITAEKVVNSRLPPADSSKKAIDSVKKTTDVAQKPTASINVVASKSTSATTVKASRIVDLFADDDEDDLFAKPKKVPATKQEVSVEKKDVAFSSTPSTSSAVPSVIAKDTVIKSDKQTRTGNISPSSDEDDLFKSHDKPKLLDEKLGKRAIDKEKTQSATKSEPLIENASNLIVASKTSVTPSIPEATTVIKDAKSSNKPLANKNNDSNGYAKSVGLFSDEEDDDLFTVAALKKNSVNASSKVDQLLNKQTGNDDTFVAEPKSNKLSVGLFNENRDAGVGDLFSTKSTLDADKVPTSDMGNRNSYDITVVGDVCVDPLSSGVRMEGRNSIFKDVVSINEEQVAKKPLPPLSSGLSQDPRKALADILRSGSKKASEDEDNVEENVSIVKEDRPDNADNSLLPSLQKTRARIPATSRRPPTKRSLPNASNVNDTDSLTDEVLASNDISTLDKRTTGEVYSVLAKDRVIHTSGSIGFVTDETQTASNVVFTEESKSLNINPIPDSVNISVASTKRSSKDVAFSDDDKEDDLFSSIKTSSVFPVVKKSDSSVKPSSVATVSTDRLKSTTIFDKDQDSSDEDLFKASASLANKNAAISATSTRTESQKAFVDNGEDDIFASDTRSRAVSKPESLFQAKPKHASVAKGLFDDEDSDTDIFK